MKSLDAADQIRADLAAEARGRARRSLLLLGLLSALVLGFAFGMGIKPELGPQDLLFVMLACGFVLLGISISRSPELRFGRKSVVGIGLVAFASPLIAATTVGETASMAMLGCGISILVLGLVGLVASRLVLGSTRRRFGGASAIQGIGAVLAAALAVSLHCHSGAALHLLTHAGAALVAGTLLRALLLR